MKQRLLVSSIIMGLCASLSVAGAVAQNTADQSQDSSGRKKETAELQGITVTGTRITNPNVVSPTPISVLTADDIKAVGAINLGDLLTSMPQLATTFTMGNSTRFIGTAGVQEQDLRNLGTNRTLVLVNGRRFVGSSAGDTGVDVNMIPVEFIDRVEIITGGASAIYGADAVTGVINFILKQKYEGVNLHAQTGTTEHGGFSQSNIAGTAGFNFLQDKGNAAFSVEHASNDSFRFPQRFGNEAYRSLRTPGGPTNTVLMPNAGSYTITNGGTFSLGSPTNTQLRYVFDPNGEVRPQRFSGPFDKGGTCQDCDRLDANQVLQLQPAYDRTTVTGVASFEFSPNTRFYWEGNYSHVRSNQQFQPAFEQGMDISPDNAYITPKLAGIMNGSDIFISRFDVDAGLRGEATTRNLARMVFGINGTFHDDWQYDASINYGETRETRRNLNNRIVERFFASVDAVRDPATGNIVCRSTLDPTSINANTGDVVSAFGRDGCIPTSVFGNGAINRAAANWFNATTYTRSKLTQYVLSASLTNNNLFEMPTGAGAVSVAGGVEYRRETSGQDNDPLDIAGLTFLNAIPSFTGAYNVKEAYVETAIPLVANLPFVKSLTLDGAYRGSDYSTAGHTKAWKYGLDWAFDDNVRMRGTMSAAVRAPNIGELFSGVSQNFFSVTDPCSVSQIPNAPNPALRRTNCAALGVPANFESIVGATINGQSGSNPNLKPETGRTYTFGFVITPQFLPGLDFNVDYWNIKLTDAISAVSGQDIVNHCVDAPSTHNAYCPNATRDQATHELSFISQTNLNLSALNTSGIDFGASYTHDLFDGRMKWKLDATRVILYTEYPFQEDPTETVQDNGTLGFPEWKASLGATYTRDNWQADWSMRYFSSMLRVTNESYASNPKQTTPITAGSRTYNDLRVAYKLKGWEVYGGINNIFDRDPPVNIFGTSFGGGLYNTLGRSYYAGINYKF